MIKSQVKADFDTDVTLTKVRRILKNNFRMKYKVIKRVPFLGNTIRSLNLRHQFAINLIDVLRKGKRVINIDETWIPYSDFRRKKWRQKGDNNSVPLNPLGYRVNMIAAIDTEGNVYISLTQFNTDTNVMLMFLSRLATVLYRERPDWRDDTVILLDGAPYHKSEETKRHMINLGLKVMFTAPYSYDASPIERFFAHFKQVDINPDKLATGKR